MGTKAVSSRRHGSGGRARHGWGLLLAVPLLACSSNGGVPAATGGNAGRVGAGSGGSGSGGHPGTGGVGAGGALGTGGASTGGAPGVGGAPGSGGLLGAGSGGAPGSGGTLAAGGNGGASHQATGGAAGAAAGGKKGGSGGKGMGGTMGTGGSGGGSGGAGGGSAGMGGAGPGSGGAGGGGPSTAALLTDLGDAFCTAARTCCTAANLPSTLDDCETKFQSRLSPLTKVSAGLETIDTTALSACIAGYRATASTCAFQPLEAACKGVFVGTKPEGAACGKGGMPWTSAQGECLITGRVSECVWTGDANLSTTTGICHTAARGKAGDPCAVSCQKNDDCAFDLLTSVGAPTAACLEEDGLYCASSGSQSVCAPIVATGGSCESDPSSCASTDYCDSSTTPAKCRTAATLGQSCGSGMQCANGMSLECGTSNKCVDLGFAYDLTCGGTPPFPL